MRPLFFPQAAFWFEATFVSDQKEQETCRWRSTCITGRQVRHLDRLLDRGRLAETPSLPLAETRHPGLASAYPIRGTALSGPSRLWPTPGIASQDGWPGSSNASAATTATFELRWRSRTVAQSRGEDSARFKGRLEALYREEQVRTAELRRRAS